jgi:hypothetical protein
MRPEELLTTLAQLGEAVAGFSGIVVVLAKSPANELPARHSMLDVLLLASFGVVLWSLAPLVMLTTPLAVGTVWKLSSAGWSVQQFAALAARAVQVRRSPESAPPRNLVVPLAAGGLTALALQLATPSGWGSRGPTSWRSDGGSWCPS